MKPIQITQDFSVTAKFLAERVAAVAQLGFRSIIDASSNSVSSEKFAIAARDAGVSYRPVVKQSETISYDLVESFCVALGALQKPILAFSDDEIWPATLWALCETKRAESNVIIQTLVRAGFDINSFHDLHHRLDAYRDRSLWSSVNFAITF